MSMENAILEHAAALRELAAAILAKAGSPAHAAAYETAQHNADMDKLCAADTIEADVTRVEQEAKAAQQKAMDKVEAERKPSAAKEAITKALDAAKAEKEPTMADAMAAATDLDYEKDVKPKLLAVGKDKGAFVALLAEFGVGKELKYAKADQLPKGDYPALVAKADAILAARG